MGLIDEFSRNSLNQSWGTDTDNMLKETKEAGPTMALPLTRGAPFSDRLLFALLLDDYYVFAYDGLPIVKSPCELQ